MTADRNGNNTNGNSHHTAFYQPTTISPSEERFRQHLKTAHGVTIDAGYPALHKWSVEHYPEFWRSMMEFGDVQYTGDISRAVMPGGIADFPEWFPDCRLNYAENCLKHGKPEDPAFITAYSATKHVVHTYKDLKEDVLHLASKLRGMGVTVGDAICGFLPNAYETAVAMFATAAIGAVWSSASVDFGPRGVLDRFQQVRPKILFTVDAVKYKGKRFDLHDKINAVVEGLDMLESVILFKHLLPEDGDRSEGELSPRVKDILRRYDEMKETTVDTSDFRFEQVPFKQPLFIMFSSGTTGVPKAIVHSVGGTLLKHVEEHLIQENASSSDRILFYTTCGWMMWNWLMTFTFTGGSIVTYEESPLEPDPHILIKIAANLECTIIGAGAKLYDEYTKMGVDFKSIYNLNKLRMILSTGSPLKAASFEFINDSIAPGGVIGSISGGTDIIGCFMGSSLSLPVYPGECQCLYLGMDIKAFDENGTEVWDEQGELVCLTPFPSMPTHFLNDPGHVKYKAAYYDRFSDVWAHGDFCVVNKKTGGVVMLGRSDATLNRGGVRIGTADIYAVVERFEEIDDCIVAGQNIPKEEDESILLFVKMKAGVSLDDPLKKKICTLIRTMMSPRHIPNAIHAIEDIPYTNSGKKVELAVKKIINGAEVQKASSLRNPDSLDLYKKYVLTAN